MHRWRVARKDAVDDGWSSVKVVSKTVPAVPSSVPIATRPAVDHPAAPGRSVALLCVLHARSRSPDEAPNSWLPVFPSVRQLGLWAAVARCAVDPRLESLCAEAVVVRSGWGIRAAGGVTRR
eukprot:3486759-Pyramimonas_sp.AAC.1